MPSEILTFEPGDAVKFNKLFNWAKDQGLEVERGMKFPELIAVIQAAHPDKTQIELDTGSEPPHTEPSVTGPAPGDSLGLRHPELAPDHYKNDPLVTITIASDDENGGKRPVPLCVNGDFIWVQRNVKVDIPYRFYRGSLEDAVQVDYRQEEGPNKTTLLIGDERPAFRYTVHKSPTDEEIAAWRERTKDIGRDKTEDPSLKQDAAVDALAGKLLEKLQQAAA